MGLAENRGQLPSVYGFHVSEKYLSDGPKRASYGVYCVRIW